MRIRYRKSLSIMRSRPGDDAAPRHDDCREPSASPTCRGGLADVRRDATISRAIASTASPVTRSSAWPRAQPWSCNAPGGFNTGVRRSDVNHDCTMTAGELDAFRQGRMQGAPRTGAGRGYGEGTGYRGGVGRGAGWNMAAFSDFDLGEDGSLTEPECYQARANRVAQRAQQGYRCAASAAPRSARLTSTTTAESIRKSALALTPSITGR